MAVFDCPNTSLKQGNSGEKVKTLQTHLKSLGYYKKTIDSSYGYYTSEAVKAFQRAHGNSVDGWFGPKTCKKFNAAIEAKNTSTTTTTSTANALKKNTDGYPFDCPNTNFKRGDKGDAVKELQNLLKEYKYYTREVDSEYGEHTEEAVKAFQKTQSGLAQDGFFGPVTCQKFAEKYSADKNAKAASAGTTSKKEDASKNLAPIPEQPPNSVLTIHPEVVVLPESVLETSGDASSGVTVTHTLVGGSIDVSTNFDCSKADMKKGSKGEDVKKLQTLLKARGYYTREIDGDFGTYTEAAVKRLQKVQGNSEDGWFGPKTCNKLQSTSSTSSTSTGTKDKKNKDYYLDDWSTVPSFTDDMEGLSHDLTLKTPYTLDKLDHMRKLQKTTFVMEQDGRELYSHQGYINTIKITPEDNEFFIELGITGYGVFLNQTIEGFGKTAKRSALLKELIEMAGLRANVDLTGLDDSEYTIKAQKQETTTKEGSGEGLTQVSGNDCTPTASINGWSFNIDSCAGNTKIGNSSANYATDTANMSAKEAILDVYNRFRYGRPGNSSVYYNNLYCPRQMWNKSGTIYGNCADISRLIKCVGEVHGLKVGIKHTTNHYYNLIEVNGQTYRFDCCFKRGVTGANYGGEICNTLTMRGGPWQ